MTGNITRTGKLDHWCDEFAALAERYTILAAVSGSHVHGLDKPDSDRDVTGVLVEPPRYVIGLEGFEQYQAGTSAPGERTQPGGEDKTIYSLRKWARQAGEGNPPALLLAFTPDAMVLHETDAGRDLRAIREVFVSREAVADRYIGYLGHHRDRLLGVRSKHSNRHELVDAFGFDTKDALHMVRAGWQGVELLRTGTITLPMRPDERDWLLALRDGRHTLTDALAEASESVEQLRVLRELADWPKQPNWPGINTWLRHTYMREWTRNGLI